MKAIVCDKCGKVVLLEDEFPYRYPSGIYRLVHDGGEAKELDLCETCTNELVDALRRTKEDPK